MATWNLDCCCFVENDCVTVIWIPNVQNKRKISQVGYQIDTVK